MKMRMMMTVAMLVAGVVTETVAEEPAKLAVVKRSEHTYKVIYSGDAAETILTIKDQFGEVVFSDRINSARGFILPLNFSSLKPGTYTIEVVAGREKFSETIVLGRLRNPGSLPLTAHVAYLGKNRYLCSVKAEDQLPVTLSVQDANGEVYAEYRVEQPETAFVVSLKNFFTRPVFVFANEGGYSVAIRK